MKKRPQTKDPGASPATKDSAPGAGEAPPPFDRATAEPIDPPQRHEPTARTVAWRQAGWLYSATGVPVARDQKAD